MKRKSIYGEHFCGNKVSDYGLENGYVDYGTFSKAFDAVLNNEIISVFPDEWELVNGLDPEEEMRTMREELETLEEELPETEDGETRKEMVKRIESLKEEIDEMEDYSPWDMEVFQHYIVSDSGAEIIQDYTDDPLWYNESLDMYLWGITHFGTSWYYVLTNIATNGGK